MARTPGQHAAWPTADKRPEMTDPARRHEPRETRRNVSVLFVDIVGSTAIAERLDPEALRILLDAYFERCSRAVQEHGGIVEKFIGDAVLAAFGTEVSHEDDALRAIRSAVDTLAALADLNADLTARKQEVLAVRCGICSGEVVVLTAPDGGFRVVGDSVNTASRLQNAAAPGEIFIDAVTASMVKHLVAIEPVRPMMLKGKASPIEVWRVVTDAAISSSSPSARWTIPTIDREEERELLRRAYRMAAGRPQMCQVTVLGEPGIGKSRLVRDFVSELSGAASRASVPEPTVLAGHCAAYGTGITYRPLAEAVRSWPGGWPALEQLLRADEGSGAAAADRLATIIDDAGQAQAPGARLVRRPHAEAGVEELAWAARCLVRIAARRSPVVIIWEDLHRAEPTLLDLIDEISTWLTDVPVLQICVARPELLSVRPGWGGGKPCAVTLDVPPLTTEQSAELIGALASRADQPPGGIPDAAERDNHEIGAVSAHAYDGYTRAAMDCDGNPLFAELLFETAGADGRGTSVPPTIHAMLGARLDQLPGSERDVLERAALIGREFEWEQLRALCTADLSHAETQAAISELVRRRIIQHGQAPGSFRFAQALLRDAAYSLTTKSRRERWHLTMADWLAEHRDPAGSDQAGQAAIAMACHVETACQIRRELVPGMTELPEQAALAARVLVAAGEQALARTDLPAAAGLLERARELLAADDPARLRLALRIVDACIGMWDGERALAALAAVRAAPGGGSCDHRTFEVAELTVKWRLRLEEPAMLRAKAAEVTAALGGATHGADDELTRCRLYQLLAYIDLADEHAGDATSSLRRGLSSALALGDTYEEERILCAICELAQWSPDPVSDGLAVCDQLEVRLSDNRALLIPVLLTRARLSAMAGDLQTARESVETTRQHANDLHLDMATAATCEVAGFVESVAGALDAALARFGEAETMLRSRGQHHDANTVRAARARILLELNVPAEAAAAIADLDPGTDRRTEVMVTSLRARLADGPSGIVTARRAVALAMSTQDPCLQGDAWLDLALVLAKAEAFGEAATAAREAADRYRSKGAALLANRVPDYGARLHRRSRDGGPDDQE
jgi:class 3 adenylate cyclase